MSSGNRVKYARNNYHDKNVMLINCFVNWMVDLAPKVGSVVVILLSTSLVMTGIHLKETTPMESSDSTALS
ncbi:unnamed protein product, partial [marine sediment metagenome]